MIKIEKISNNASYIHDRPLVFKVIQKKRSLGIELYLCILKNIKNIENYFSVD